MPRIVLISGGPQQLLALVALMRQLHKTEQVVGIVSYVSESDRLISFEKYVCELFGFDYLGSIAEFRQKIVELGFGNPYRIARTFLRRDLCLQVQTWLSQIGLWAVLSESEIAMSYRENLVTDNLLLNSVNPKNVFLVPDGVYLTMDNNLVRRFVSRLFGVKNFYSRMTCNHFSPNYLSPLHKEKFNCFVLEAGALQDVYSTLSRHLRLRAETVLNAGVRLPVTLLIWQNLYPKFIADKSVLLNFFLKIVVTEAETNTNHILVKPHPRNTRIDIQELCEKLPSSLKDRVTVIQEDMLVASPVEIMKELYNISRVVGIASTGLLSLCRGKSIEVGIYSSLAFPSRLRAEINRFTNLMGVEAVDI